MKLAELRSEWEKKSETLFVVVENAPKCGDLSQTVYVVVGSENGYEFRLLRYFTIGLGDNQVWDVSVDLDWTEDLVGCLAKVSDSFAYMVPQT